VLLTSGQVISCEQCAPRRARLRVKCLPKYWPYFRGSVPNPEKSPGIGWQHLLEAASRWQWYLYSNENYVFFEFFKD